MHCHFTGQHVQWGLSLGELSDQNLTKPSYFREKKTQTKQNQKSQTRSLPGSLQFVCTKQHTSRTPVWDLVPNLQIKWAATSQCSFIPVSSNKNQGHSVPEYVAFETCPDNDIVTWFVCIFFWQFFPKMISTDTITMTLSNRGENRLDKKLLGKGQGGSKTFYFLSCCAISSLWGVKVT